MLGSWGGVEVDVANVVLGDISTIFWMDDERADMMDSDSEGIVDRTTGMEVIFSVPAGVKVAVMVMGIEEVATLVGLGRLDVEMIVSEVSTNVVVFVMIAVTLLLLAGGVELMGVSERAEGTGSVNLAEDTVSAIVAVVVGSAAAKAVMDVGNFTPAIAQSWDANAYVAAVGLISNSLTTARLEGSLVARRGKLTSLLGFVTLFL